VRSVKKVTSRTRQVLKNKFVRDQWIEASITNAKKSNNLKREFLLNCTKVYYTVSNRTRAQDIYNSAKDNMSLAVSIIIFNPIYNATTTYHHIISRIVSLFKNFIPISSVNTQKAL